GARTSPPGPRGRRLLLVGGRLLGGGLEAAAQLLLEDGLEDLVGLGAAEVAAVDQEARGAAGLVGGAGVHVVLEALGGGRVVAVLLPLGDVEAELGGDRLEVLVAPLLLVGEEG